MPNRIEEDATFYHNYNVLLDTLNAAMVLRFTKKKIKKVYGIAVSGISNVTGGVKDAAGNTLMALVVVGKGKVSNQLNTPPLTDYQGQIDGVETSQHQVLITDSQSPQISFNPPIQVSENEDFFVWCPSCYQQADGAQHDTTVSLNVFGQFLAPQVNAQLPIDTYINTQSTNQL